ncbi:hypothetical protein [Haladaptatus salinisoli]|uniref:hypothetical protein n=1 Tax=Haladaptatus salinisoli TaxID=2884876 RepID=UPI0034A37A79
MAQETSIDPALTVRENLRFACRAYGVPADDRRDRIDDLLEFAGLAETRDESRPVPVTLREHGVRPGACAAGMASSGQFGEPGHVRGGRHPNDHAFRVGMGASSSRRSSCSSRSIYCSPRWSCTASIERRVRPFGRRSASSNRPVRR